jgi:hypothetical protein
MFDANWGPALSTTGLLAGVLWLLRKLILTRLTASVNHEFNEKIEALRADLKLKEEEISSLRAGALNAMASRKGALDQRQLQAVEQLWAATMEIARTKHISGLMAIVKYEYSMQEAEKNPRFREAFEIMGGGFDIGKLDLSSATKARPFLSPMSWAYFSAYQAIAMQAVAKWTALRHGINAPDMFDHESVKKLVTAALPHREEYIESMGDRAYHYLLEELEELLLSELRAVMDSEDLDRRNVERAAKIVALSKEAQANAIADGERSDTCKCLSYE